MLRRNHGTLRLHNDDDDELFPVSLLHGYNLQVMLQKNSPHHMQGNRLKHFIMCHIDATFLNGYHRYAPKPHSITLPFLSLPCPLTHHITQGKYWYIYLKMGVTCVSKLFSCVIVHQLALFVVCELISTCLLQNIWLSQMWSCMKKCHCKMSISMK